MANAQLFREESLKRIASADQPTDSLKLVGPGVWVALGAILMLLVSLIAWGFWGKLPQTVRLEGLYYPLGGVISVDAPEGRVRRMFVRTGGEIAAGDAVCEMESGEIVCAAEDAAGLIVSCLADGDEARGPVARVMTDGGRKDTVICLLDLRDATVQPGMQARLGAPGGGEADCLLGEVESVEKLGITAAEAVSLLGSAELLTGPAGGRLAVIRLITDGAGGFLKPSGEIGGAPSAPMYMDVTVVTRNESPAQTLLGL